MEITKELLEKRLKLLAEQRALAQAQVYGYDGAMQEAQHWLEELEKTEEEKVKTADVITLPTSRLVENGPKE